MTLDSGGVRCSRLWSNNHLASSAVTPTVSVHKSRSDNVLRMWVQLKMMCVVCMDVTGGHSGDGCVMASTLCKCDLRKGDLFLII